MRTLFWLTTLVCLLLSAAPVPAQHLLRVGPGRAFETIQAAINEATDNDTILIDNGPNYDEYLTFPTPITGLSLLAEYTVILHGIDTFNATNLLIDGVILEANVQQEGGILLRSDGVRIRNVQCNNLLAFCLEVPEPVEHIYIDYLVSNGAAPMQIRGSHWLVENAQAGQVPGQAAPVQFQIQGSYLTLRNTFAMNTSAPGSICYRVQGHHITLDGAYCAGAERGVVITSGHDITVQDTHVWAYAPFSPMVVEQSGTHMLFQRNQVGTLGFPRTACGLRLKVGTGVVVRGNRFQDLKRAYCGAGRAQATIAGNLLRDITTPEPAPGDVVESTEPIT